MIKHILQYFLFAATMFAAGAPAVGGGDGGSQPSGDPGAGGGGSGPAGGSGSPGGQGSGGGQPQGGSPQAGQPGQGGQPGPNPYELRQSYEQLKAKHEAFEKLGFKPEQITQFSGVYQKAFGEAQAIGRELGYPDDEIAEALAEDPIRTIDFLRNQANTAQQDRVQSGEADLQELIQRGIEQQMGPIQQRENIRMTDTANALFEQTVRQLAVDSFKAEGLDVANIPQDEMNALMSAASEIMKYDQEALHSLKYEGKTASVQKAFQEARTFLDKYYLARSGRERTRLAPPRAGQPAPQRTGDARKPTLDEIIDNPGVINQKYA